MPHDAAQGDGIDASELARPEAQIDVFAAIHVGFIEAAELLPQGALYEHAGSGDSRHGADGMQPPRNQIRQRAIVHRLPGYADDEPGMINCAGSGVALNISDETRPGAEARVGGEHRFEPVRL